MIALRTHDGRYLATADPQFVPPPPNPPYPSGLVTFTDVEAEALKFETVEEAWTLLTAVCEGVPWRPDGEPNRPLRAFTVEVVTCS